MKKRIKLLFRKNLKMTEGKIAAQCVHAALGLNLILLDTDEFRETNRCLDPMLSVVVLGVSDAKFKEARETLAKACQPFYVVSDAGYTEVASGTETVVAYLEDDPREVNKGESK